MPFHSSPGNCPVCGGQGHFDFVRDFSSDEGEFTLYECPSCVVQFWLPFKNPGVAWYEAQDTYRAQEPNLYRDYHKISLHLPASFPENARVLDMGCGTGEFINELRNKGCEVWGVDSDKIDIETAKKWFGLRNLYAVAVEDFFSIPDLPQFDMVTFFEVIEHLDKPVEFVRKVSGLLKPGGRIIMSAPSRERMWADLYKWDLPPYHLSRWNEEAVRKLAEKNGLEVLSVKYSDQYHHFVELFSMYVTNPMRNAGFGRLVVVPAYYAFVVLPAKIMQYAVKIINPKNGVMVVELAAKKVESPEEQVGGRL